MSEVIPTNDVFKDLCILLRIHKDKDFQVELFRRAGWDVSRSKVQAWARRTGEFNKDFRPMPQQALRDFIDILKSEKLYND